MTRLELRRFAAETDRWVDEILAKSKVSDFGLQFAIISRFDKWWLDQHGIEDEDDIDHDQWNKDRMAFFDIMNNLLAPLAGPGAGGGA